MFNAYLTVWTIIQRYFILGNDFVTDKYRIMSNLRPMHNGMNFFYKGYSILYGLPASHIQRLQTFLNSAARLIAGSRRFDHITPVLKSLHWLSYPQRVTYKIRLLVFRSLRGLAPGYLSDFCHSVSTVPGRASLHSSAHGQLLVPKIKTKLYGDHSFAVSGPIKWNRLPFSLHDCSISLSTFKKRLKTHIFCAKNYGQQKCMRFGVCLHFRAQY